jgi:hypothetical protein
MATKLIAFRISGNLLDQAIDQLGADQIAEKSRELLSKFILSQIPADNSIHELTSTDRNLPESQIDDLQNQINDLYSRIDQLENNRSITELKSSDRPVITELNSQNEDQVMTAPVKPKSDIAILDELLNIKNGPAISAKKKKFKKLTGIDPDSMGENAYPKAMLKYLQDNPQFLAPKENQ